MTARLILAMALLLWLPSAHASGFFLPWWAELVFFLFVTPQGWAVCGLIVVVMVAAIVAWVRRARRQRIQEGASDA